MARVTFSDTLTKQEAVVNLARQGVLTEEQIQRKSNRRGEVGAFAFDNLVVFERRFRTWNSSEWIVSEERIWLPSRGCRTGSCAS